MARPDYSLIYPATVASPRTLKTDLIAGGNASSDYIEGWSAPNEVIYQSQLASLQAASQERVNEDYVYFVIPDPFIINDDFARAVTGGLGVEPTSGLSWAFSGGSGTDYSVVNASGGYANYSNGVTGSAREGQIVVPGTTPPVDYEIYAEYDLQTTLTGGLAPWIMNQARRSSVNTDSYRQRVLVNPSGGAVTMFVAKRVGGVDTDVISNVTVLASGYVPGTRIYTRFQVEGTAPVTLRAKAWVGAAAEPASFQVATDSTPSAAGQAAGRVGTLFYSASATPLPIVNRNYLFQVKPI